MKACVGLECDCHACKCIKISEQSAKILIPTVLITQASYQTGGGDRVRGECLCYIIL